MPSEEEKFLKWYAGHAKKLKINPDPYNPRHKYDYKKAWKAGEGPGPKGHWPSKYKHDDHPNRFLIHKGWLMDTKHGVKVKKATRTKGVGTIKKDPYNRKFGRWYGVGDRFETKVKDGLKQR